MRVCLDCRMATWSGVGRYTRGLARALADVHGVELVQLIAPGVEPPADAASLVADGHPFSLAGSIEYGRLVRKSGCDLVHSLHFPVPFPVRAPVVVTMHDVSPLVVEGLMPSALKRAVYRMKVQRAVRVADAIITLSAHTARDLEHHLRIPVSSVTVIPGAADEFADAPVGQLPGWLEGRRYLLSMGNTRPHKDLPTLLRAFAALGDNTLLLVLAGDDVAGYAASVLGDHPAVSRVRFTGSADDPTLRGLFASATAFVFPSRYEGFGLPPLEAMSSGTPVIAARAASVPEVVGEAGLYFEPGDVEGLTEAIERVMGEPDLATGMAGLGRARAAGFTWARAATATAGVYELTLGNCG